jgi:signal transduction histidine kinase
MPGLRHASPVHRGDAHAVSAATLTDIDIRHELESRPWRSPQYEREHDLFLLLAAALAANAHDILQNVANVGLDLCAAGSAGISLLEADQIRWAAVAGALASARGRTCSKHECPTGLCLQRDATQLLHLPDRCFRSLPMDPKIVEMLLIPFHDRGTAIGAVWVVRHSPQRGFDREDERIVRVLAQYASAGWQLWKMHEAAAESNRRKERMLAVLGHELRNPLSAITAATAVLDHQVKDAHGARAIEVITRQARLLERLAGDLLDRSRLASGKLQLEITAVDLWRIVAEALDTCRAKVEQRRLQVSVALPHAPATVDGDPQRLAQVFSNLIENAVKFTPEGGRVTIGGVLDGNHATVSVRDTGIGIPCDQLQRVFEPYAQIANPDRTSPSSGLGLGLSLVRSLVELHRGSVTVASDGVGQGSCFTVRLPIRRLN